MLVTKAWQVGFLSLTLGMVIFGSERIGNAAIIQADIYENLNLPAVGGGLPREFDVNDRAVAAGPELTLADEISNPELWFGFLIVDLSGSSFTLTHDAEFTDYQTTQIVIDDLVFDTPGQVITGVTLITPSIIDAGASDPFTELISFTGNSITLDWFVNDIPAVDIFNFFDGGSASYQITFGAAAVPEPASLTLVGFGVMGMAYGAIRRRRRPTA